MDLGLRIFFRVKLQDNTGGLRLPAFFAARRIDFANHNAASARLASVAKLPKANGSESDSVVIDRFALGAQKSAGDGLRRTSPVAIPKQNEQITTGENASSCSI